MKRIQKILLLNYLFSLGLALLWVVLNENDVFELVGTLHTDANSDFMLTSVMEIITICSIPIALRLFKFGTIRETVRKDNSQLHSTFLAFSLVRLDMLLVPMLVNAMLYYLFMNVAFGYMAIILFLACFFVFPSQERCEQEYNDMLKS